MVSKRWAASQPPGESASKMARGGPRSRSRSLFDLRVRRRNDTH